MKIPKLGEEKAHEAKLALETATSENVIECCQKYLKQLEDYRDELYKFRGSPQINRQLKSELSREEVDSLRKQVRAAVEKTTRERNKMEELLKSFMAISGYEAVQTLNQSQYKGFDSWELKAGGVRFEGGTEADKISVQEAVGIASLHRRQEYVNRQITFER